MSHQFNKVISEEIDNIRIETSRLRIYTKALRVLGNLDFADKLSAIADHLDDTANRLVKEYGMEIVREVQRTEQASNNMFGAYMAGVKTGEKESETRE